jgi:nicotinate-nucleotide pyrophosphorylase
VRRALAEDVRWGDVTTEETPINFLSRLWGVAGETRAFADVCRGRITLLDTGATTPILRALEACAVWVGLYGGVQVIAKHVLLVGRVGEAVTAAVVPVELEA